MSDYKKFKSKDGKEYFIPNAEVFKTIQAGNDQCCVNRNIGTGQCDSISCSECVARHSLPVHAEYMASLKTPEPYPLDKVGNCTENGVMVECSDSENFDNYKTVELIRVEKAEEFGGKFVVRTQTGISIYRYARHPQPKEAIVYGGVTPEVIEERMKKDSTLVFNAKPKALTDEEIVGEGYVRITPKTHEEMPNPHEYCYKNKIGEWKIDPAEKRNTRAYFHDTYYFRVKKTAPLTESEKHEILLRNVSAGGCWVKYAGDNRLVINYWCGNNRIINYKIRLPDSTEYVEITDEVLRSLNK